jgi:4-amino-4-deoxy-L-arabinose transferase-like glycosyltransferase
MRWRLLLPGLALMLGLAAYILAGMQAAPFHGDEATIISMSADWYALQAGQSASLAYQPNPTGEAAANQELRLLNGVLSKYIMGWAWATQHPDPASQINKQWVWGASWAYNLADGHMPSAPLLATARFTNLMALLASLPLVLQIGWRLGGGWVGIAAMCIYGLTPAVLLNGRRATYEGLYLFFCAALLWLTLILATKPRFPYWILLGLVSGLALATKHNAALNLIAAFLPLLVLGLWRGRHDKFRQWPLLLAKMAAATLLAVALFWALNPAWWPDPLAAAGEVWRLRTALIAEQANFFGAMPTFSARLEALFTLPMGAAQYFEDPNGWGQWLAASIGAYEQAGLAGIALGMVGMLLAGLGAFSLLLGRTPERWAFLAGSGLLLALLLATNPLAWQRYYLPVQIPLAVLAALGISGLFKAAMSALRRLRTAPLTQ